MSASVRKFHRDTVPRAMLQLAVILVLLFRTKITNIPIQTLNHDLQTVFSDSLMMCLWEDEIFGTGFVVGPVLWTGKKPKTEPDRDRL
jgi:hypothetical protein